MTNLRRYDINICNCEFGPHTERDENIDGAYVVATDALAIIEALQAEVVAKDKVIDDLYADVQRGVKRIVELLQLKQSLERQLADAEKEISVLSAPKAPQRFSEFCFDNR